MKDTAKAQPFTSECSHTAQPPADDVLPQLPADVDRIDAGTRSKHTFVHHNAYAAGIGYEIATRPRSWNNRLSSMRLRTVEAPNEPPPVLPADIAAQLDNPRHPSKQPVRWATSAFSVSASLAGPADSIATPKYQLRKWLNSRASTRAPPDATVNPSYPTMNPNLESKPRNAVTRAGSEPDVSSLATGPHRPDVGIEHRPLHPRPR